MHCFELGCLFDNVVRDVFDALGLGLRISAFGGLHQVASK